MDRIEKDALLTKLQDWATDAKTYYGTEVVVFETDPADSPEGSTFIALGTTQADTKQVWVDSMITWEDAAELPKSYILDMARDS